MQLFGACLSGDAALHGRLADLLLHASHTLAACRRAGTQRRHCQSITDGLARAIAALKLRVRCWPLHRLLQKLCLGAGATCIWATNVGRLCQVQESRL